VRPGAFPCQLLDHGTGYLAAAAALEGLARQAERGGSHVRRLSLARTASWLTSRPGRPSLPESPDDDRYVAGVLQSIDAADVTLTAVRPPGAVAGRGLTWPAAPSGYGDDVAAW
jgi:hypothetical protein